MMSFSRMAVPRAIGQAAKLLPPIDISQLITPTYTRLTTAEAKCERAKRACDAIAYDREVNVTLLALCQASIVALIVSKNRGGSRP